HSAELASLSLHDVELRGLTLSTATLSELAFIDVRIARDLELRDLRMLGDLAIHRSAIEGSLNLSRVTQADGRLRIAQQTTIGEIAAFRSFFAKEICLSDSSISRAIRLGDCRAEALSLDNVTVEQQITLTDCRLCQLEMERARAGGLQIGLFRRQSPWRGAG